MIERAALPTSPWRSPLVLITAACLIAIIANGTRSIFGFFLEPMTGAHGWDRETFALAIALQNIAWGILVPIAGVLADKRGAGPVIIFGAVCYGLGIWGMAAAEGTLGLYMFGGVLVGLGVAFSSFSIAMAVIARVVSPEKRSMALGLGMAAGSLGQVLFSPLSVALIENLGWYMALIWLAIITLALIPLAFLLPRNNEAPVPKSEQPLSIGQALAEARRHRGYILLITGFFVCGFHVAFIAVHFPAYVTDLGLDPRTGGYALSLIGLMNIIGSFAAGLAGQRFSMKFSLSVIYFCRALAITGLMLAPKTETTLLLFAAVMGLLWLSTIPLTSGIVARIFGVQYLGLLFGIALLSHQIGSFLGVWLGGWLYDQTGGYDAIWWIAVALGIFAALIHLPIDERPTERIAGARTA